MSETKHIDVFQRVEDKYRMSRKEAMEILEEMKGYIKKDEYFQYTVHNIYYDSPDSRMIIESLNSPRFKEKLRLRCYEQPGDDTLCFLETKKKFGDIVYKKRIALNHKEAMAYLNEGVMHHVKNNTADEIDYLLNYYSCQPKTLILYDRTCFSSINEADVRVTFDCNIRYRNDDISLTERGDETQLIGDDVVMEIKAMNRYPMWLVQILSRRKLYKHSFSKYGMIYRQNYKDMTVTGTPVIDRYMNEKENRVCSVQY